MLSSPTGELSFYHDYIQVLVDRDRQTFSSPTGELSFYLTLHCVM